MRHRDKAALWLYVLRVSVAILFFVGQCSAQELVKIGAVVKTRITPRCGASGGDETREFVRQINSTEGLIENLPKSVVETHIPADNDALPGMHNLIPSFLIEVREIASANLRREKGHQRVNTRYLRNVDIAMNSIADRLFTWNIYSLGRQSYGDIFGSNAPRNRPYSNGNSGETESWIEGKNGTLRTDGLFSHQLCLGLNFSERVEGVLGRTFRSIGAPVGFEPLLPGVSDGGTQAKQSEQREGQYKPISSDIHEERRFFAFSCAIGIALVVAFWAFGS